MPRPCGTPSEGWRAGGAEHLAIRVLTNMTPSGTIHTVYDRDGNLLMESNGLATGITREHIWLPETQIAPSWAPEPASPAPWPWWTR